jgi:acyl-CoA thioesterase-1
MARGFESKDVEYQQAEAERTKTVRPRLTPDEREAQAKRRTIELALTHARADLAAARSPAHRDMLTQAIAALEQQLLRLVLVAAIAFGTTTACERDLDRSRSTGNAGVASAAPVPAPSEQPSPSSSAPRIVILGDSLTAGLGLPVQQSYPALLQQRLKAEGLNYDVVNAGVSGDTSAGGLSRLDWSLQGDVRILVVALGGNDALRGLPVDELRANLGRIIERAQAKDISVILAGMEAPPNWGRDYDVAFHKVYPALAQQYHVPLVPFLLQDVAGSDALNQPDGIHPTAEGARIVADNIWRVLKPVAQRGS